MKAGFQKEGDNKIPCSPVYFKIKNVEVGLAHSAVLPTLPLSGSLNSVFAVRLRLPKPPSVASQTRKPLYDIGLGGFIDMGGQG